MKSSLNELRLSGEAVVGAMARNDKRRAAVTLPAEAHLKPDVLEFEGILICTIHVRCE